MKVTSLAVQTGTSNTRGSAGSKPQLVRPRCRGRGPGPCLRRREAGRIDDGQLHAGPSAGTHFDRHHQGPLLRRPLSAAYVHRSGCLLGLELASIFVIFTSQAWNMTFSFYHSLKSQPVELDEAARMYRLTKWQRFWKLDVPNACLTCPDFQTTVQFLPVHRRQAEETTALIEAAQSAGHERLAANHRRVLANLDKIISALDAIEGDGPDDD